MGVPQNSEARTVATRFYTVSQNNSGGGFDHNPAAGIGYAVCVEAVDEDHAKGRLRRITDYYAGKGYDCPCCGERWSLWIDEDDASEQPTMYGEPLKGGWGIPSYIHYLDGTIEARQPSEVA